MSNIKFKTSKKTTIILLIVLFLIIGGTGGYLLWRVNQQKTVAPTDSSAGEVSTCNCCTYPVNDSNKDCNKVLDPIPCKCTYGRYACKRDGGEWCADGDFIGQCGRDCRDTECSKGVECNSNPKSGCHACVWPEVAVCKGGYCGCGRYDVLANDCRTNKPECTEINCPAGYSDPYYLTETGQSCKAGEVETSCCGTCPGCQNDYRARVCCKPDTPPPTCGDGIVNQTEEECEPPNSPCTKNGKTGECNQNCKCIVPEEPPANICDGIGKEGSITFTPSKTKTGGKIKYQYIMGDSKEIDLNSVTVLVNHGSLRVFYPKGIKVTGLPEGSNPPHKRAKVEGELDSEIYKVGNNPVLIAWKRPGESTISSACQIRGNFVIEEETPTWGVEKSVVEECIDDGTENPSAKLRYTITITNKSTTAGTITSVEDKLDDKVVEGSVTDISDGGVYTHSDRTIRWGSFQIAAGQSKVLSYSLTIAKDAFGIYDNVVVVKPSVGTDLVDNATITADCVIGETPQPPKEGGTVPDTGLFDESENIVVIGGILLFLGLGWTWLTKTYQIVNGKLVERSRERFEQRVVKK